MGSNGYGSIHSGSRPQNHAPQPNGYNTRERTPLLSRKSFQHPPHRFRSYLAAPITPHFTDILLLANYFITGLLDSGSVLSWGNFVSMQTGNTVYIATGLLDSASPGTETKSLRALISIVAFCTGSLCFSRFHLHFGPRKRWVLALSSIMQMLFVVVAAVLVTIGPKPSPGKPLTVWVGVPIATIAFQSAGQAYESRVLGFRRMTGAALTTIYLDLFSMGELSPGETSSIQQDRRVAAPVLLLGGALLGVFLLRGPLGLMGLLWTVVLLKLLVVVAWASWQAESEQEEEC